MNITVKIAKNELRNLFYSPIAWFLIIVFLVQCTIFYLDIMYPWVMGALVVYKNDPDWIYRATESATESIFLHPQGIIANVLQNLYLFAPLLTMGIINREFNNGTIRLLYSSPVTVRQIVLGKYLALVIYSLILISVVGIFIITGFFSIKSLDYGVLLSATFGFFLLISAYIAIGFFMSSLTSYPIVAAVASFTVFFILGNIGRLWQDYDFIRDLTYFLSITDHTSRLIAGLITTKDVVYYLVIIYMFIGFTILKLKEGRGTDSWYIKASRYLALIISGLLIGYISSRTTFVKYLDVTARKTNTIHPATQQIIKELKDGPLEVTLYTNLLGANAVYGLPSARIGYQNFWEPYQRFKRDITFKYEYYYALSNSRMDSAIYKMFPGKSLKQIAGLQAHTLHTDSSLFVAPEQMSNITDLANEGYKLIMQLKYKGRSIFLRTYENAPWPTDYNINAALKRLLNTKMPKVAFVCGELERNIYKNGERDYLRYTISSDNSSAMVNIGFDIDTVNLATQDIAPDVTTVVLADPKIDLSPTVLNKLKTSIDNGVNMLILGEPGKQHVLNPLIKKLGVQLLNGQLVEPSYNETPDKVYPYGTEAAAELSEDPQLLKYKYLWSHNVHKEYDTMTVAMPGVTTFSYTGDSGFAIRPLYTSRPGKAWLKTGRLVIDSAAPVFDAANGDVKVNSFPASLQLTRRINNKEQRIIICGDADFTSNKSWPQIMVLSMYSWLNNNQFPVYTNFPYAKDNMITLTPDGIAAQKILYLWILPGLLLVVGTVLLIRRKRK